MLGKAESVRAWPAGIGRSACGSVRAWMVVPHQTGTPADTKTMAASMAVDATQAEMEKGRPAGAIAGEPPAAIVCRILEPSEGA